MGIKSIYIIIIVFLVNSGCATLGFNSEIERVKENGFPILVTEYRQSLPNSAGGVDVEVYFVNTSNQNMKYVNFYVNPYNRVGDIAPSEIGNLTTANLSKIGPIAPGKYTKRLLFNTQWNNVWYNYSIRCISIEKIKITYMDNSIEMIEDSKINSVINKRIKRKC